MCISPRFRRREKTSFACRTGSWCLSRRRPLERRLWKKEKGRAYEAEIKKALEEKLGTREKVIQDAIEKNKDDLKVALERKVSNKKLAAWIAGGAVVLAGLGYLMAPKSKNV